MDFKKVEWIFLVVFIGINLFLFSLYHEASNEQGSVLRSEGIESIQQRLASESITYTGELSESKKEGYYLSAEQTDMQEALENAVKRTTNNGLSSENISVYDNTLTRLFDEESKEQEIVLASERLTEEINTLLTDTSLFIHGGEYTYQKNFSLKDNKFSEFEAGQTYDGIPFHDDTSKIRFTLEEADNNYTLVKYTQTHLSYLEELREKMDLYSEADAIKTLYINNKIPSGSKIVWRQLAYSRILKVREKNVYVPVWFVAIKKNEKTQQIEMVNAINNTILTNSVITKVENE